jgi:signal peptidase II
MLTAFVVALDIATKALVEARLREPIDLVAGARLALGHNSGIAFGAFSDLPAWLLIVGVVIAAVGSARWPCAAARACPGRPLGSLAGGAAGNLIDRIGDGRVTDFIDLGRWPACNVADIASPPP